MTNREIVDNAVNHAYEVVPEAKSGWRIKVGLALLIGLVILNSVFNVLDGIKTHDLTVQNRNAISTLQSFHNQNVKDKQQLACAIADLASPTSDIYKAIEAKYGACPTAATNFSDSATPSPSSTPTPTPTRASVVQVPKVTSSTKPAAKPTSTTTTKPGVATPTPAPTKTAPTTPAQAPVITLPSLNLCALSPLLCTPN